MKRKIFLSLFLILLTLLLLNLNLIRYGIDQGRGQLRIVWNARPMSEVLADHSVPDSIKTKLHLVEEIRRYAFDSLGIEYTDNYTTFFDQQGQPLLWLLTAAEPYALRNKEWKFPFVGRVSYKGFFRLDKALKEREALDAEGWDTHIRTVGGWSTLGWFKDPILSNMLFRSEGDLANLLIHELTHGTIFVKDSIELNENLASFIGDQGALRFLRQKYGEDSEEWRRYLEEARDYEKFTEHILYGTTLLDTLYAQLSRLESEEEKKHSKFELIREIISSKDTLSLHRPQNYSLLTVETLPNNAWFMSVRRYRSKQDHFEKELNEDFGGNLTAYLQYLKQIHPYKQKK
jgi:predicted aminopeptidase